MFIDESSSSDYYINRTVKILGHYNERNPGCKTGRCLYIQKGKECSCVEIYYSRVKEIKEAYIARVMAQNYKDRNIARYVLDPSVKKLIKMYNDYIQVINRSKT